MREVYTEKSQVDNRNVVNSYLKSSQSKEIIDFSVGIPAPEFFPTEQFKEVCNLILKENKNNEFADITSKGYWLLRSKIAKRLNYKFNTNICASDILITKGSREGLDLVSKTFLEKDDIVLCEDTTYVGALDVFKQYGCQIISVGSDANGILLDEIENIIKQNKSIKLIYTIPDFQNPKGTRWSVQRRNDFIELINKYGIVVIDDNPFSELNYTEEHYPMLTTMDRKGLIITLGTFSKILSPEFKMGWLISKSDTIDKLYRMKQGSDLNTSTQIQIDKFMEFYNIDKHVEKMNKLYKRRRDIMLRSIEKYFDHNVKVTKPDGGLLMWLELPEHIDAKDILTQCLKKNVNFELGEKYFVNNPKSNTIRLSFGNTKEEKIIEGIHIIGDTYKKIMR